MSLLAVVAFLATFVEGLVEYLLSPFPELQPYLRYAALVIGVLAAIGFGVDLSGPVGLHGAAPWVGEIFTGLVIGRGANYANDFISRVRGELSVPAKG